MRNLMSRIFNVFKSDSGQGMAEYGLILFLIVVAAITITKTLGGKIHDKLDEAAKQIGNSK